MPRAIVAAVAAAMMLFGASVEAGAQAYPSKPVRVIVPFPPGGSAGAQAQIIGKAMEADLGQPVVVDYRPGAGTTIGAASVAKADPDGYTLFFAGTSHAISGTLYSNLPYDPVKSFAGVSLVAIAPLILVVPEAKNIHSLAELVKLAKERPGKLTYSSSGSGGSPHLSGEQFRMLADIQVVHVPYKGSSPAMTAVLGNEVDFGVLDVAALGNIQAGKIRALAVTSGKRSSLLPNVATMTELGYPFETPAWGGILAPAGTPKAIIDRLNAAIRKGLQDPEVQERFHRQGFDVTGSTPEEFDAHLAKEVNSYAKVVKATGAASN